MVLRALDLRKDRRRRDALNCIVDAQLQLTMPSLGLKHSVFFALSSRDMPNG